jgi:IS30 family transposase
MPPFDLKFKPTGRYLSFVEREEIALLRAQEKGVREIARTIGRDPGTISRELRRNAAVRYGSRGYRASVAQWKADMAAKRPKAAKLVTNVRLHTYVHERLSGKIITSNGKVIVGPMRMDSSSGKSTFSRLLICSGLHAVDHPRCLRCGLLIPVNRGASGR